MTEWPSIVNYDINNYSKLMNYPLVLDGRNCYSLKDMEKINNIIKKYNYPIVDTDNFIFYSEYLPFLFADKILFTNQSGMDLMLNTLTVDEIKEDIIKASQKFSL